MIWVSVKRDLLVGPCLLQGAEVTNFRRIPLEGQRQLESPFSRLLRHWDMDLSMWRDFGAPTVIRSRLPLRRAVERLAGSFIGTFAPANETPERCHLQL